MLTAPMTHPLRDAILEVAAKAEPKGATMGEIVDAIASEGFTATAVEGEIWQLMADRRLTPAGFVYRRVRRTDDLGEPQIRRSYEFLLITWSPGADKQLELALAAGDEHSP